MLASARKLIARITPHRRHSSLGDAARRHCETRRNRSFKEGRSGESDATTENHTALLVSELASAEDWYTKLLGRKPDFRPMDTLVQWELGASGGLQLTSQDDLAGKGAMSLVVADVEEERRRLDALGIALGDSTQGTYSTLAQLRDRDGNLIVLATPPSPSYPPA